MQPFIPVILFSLFAVLSCLHVYWAFGGTWASQKVVPLKPDGTPLFSPGPGITLIVALLFFLGASYYLTGLVGLHSFQGAFAYPGWMIALIFLLRSIGDFRYVGFLKRVGGSDFARLDTLLYSPLCLMLSGLNLLMLQTGL